MKKIFLLAILLFLTLFMFPSMGEDSKIDEENQEELSQEALKLYKNKDYKGAIEYYEKALKIYEEDNDSENIYTTSACLSVIYRLSGDEANALKYAEKMKVKLEDEDVEKEDISFDDGESLIREGIKFHKSGNLKEAAGQFEIAMKVYEKEKDPLNIYRISSYLSVLYKAMGDEGKTKEYADKMVTQVSDILQEEPGKIAEKIDKKVDNKKIETAQEQKNKEEEIDDPEDEIEKLDMEGIAFGEKGDYNGAIKKWERACAISDRYNLNEDFSFKFVRYTHEFIFDNTKVEVEETIPHIWTHLSYVYYIMGDKDNAFKYAKRLMDFSDKDTWKKVMACILMADLYSGDDYEKSLEFYNKALEYRDESVMLKYFHDTNIYDKICLLHLKHNKLDKALAVLPEQNI